MTGRARMRPRRLLRGRLRCYAAMALAANVEGVGTNVRAHGPI